MNPSKLSQNMVPTNYIFGITICAKRLWVVYINKRGVLRDRIMPPHIACKYLEEAGIIEGYVERPGTTPMICWQTDAHGAYDGCPYEEWVDTRRFTDVEKQALCDTLENHDEIATLFPGTSAKSPF